MMIYGIDSNRSMMFVKFGMIDLSETIMKHAVWISDICVSEIILLGKIMEMYKS